MPHGTCLAALERMQEKAGLAEWGNNVWQLLKNREGITVETP